MAKKVKEELFVCAYTHEAYTTGGIENSYAEIENKARDTLNENEGDGELNIYKLTLVATVKRETKIQVVKSK